MRNKFLAVLGVAGTLTLVACSSSDEVKPSASVNAPVTAASSNSANANTNAMIDGSAAIPQGANANFGMSEAAGNTDVPPQLQNRLDKLRKGGNGPSGPPVDVEAAAMKMARPAPDNSTFTSYLSDAGYEIRTFQKHPQLQKVEKRTADNGTVSIKVFLRNGKVVELPGTAIPVLSTAPATQIMNAAGISAPAEPVQTGTKKASQ
jgi:hypothetical protein